MSEGPAEFYRSMFRLWNTMDSRLTLPPASPGGSPEEPAEEQEDQSEAPPARAARQFLEALAGRFPPDQLPEPFRSGVPLVHHEYNSLASHERSGAFHHLHSLLNNSRISPPGIGEPELGQPDISEQEISEPPLEISPELIQALHGAFFPEALHPDIPELRRRRQVKITRPVPDPLTSPVQEILFTSNVLLSPPREPADPAEPSDPETRRIIRRAAEAAEEPQLYWYDHPVPLGVPIENDEVLYGLSGLSEALRSEVTRGGAGAADTLRICLSVSVTHKGLHAQARPWLKARLAAASPGRLHGIEAYAFTEADTAAVLDLLIPWLSNPGDEEPLRAAFGVDGEYGRHYSFLKALPALWSVLLDPRIKAAFKIDLDQVFPQAALIEETGKSAFEHFTTPLWGALAADEGGRPVELGMIAGALVNEKDISRGLFTPDIPWPETPPAGENRIFFKQLPMALSTRAELTARYGASGTPDGIHEALQRIHVTGGTNGIRLDALRRHRPFTPSFVGRAEDQAYLLSVLSPPDKPENPENPKPEKPKPETPALRYLHASGLIMRHDKEAFAGSAVKAGKAGSYVGDLVRLFVFSAYARLLPGGPQAVKSQVDPFTGCFITPIPATLALLQLALHLRSSGPPGPEGRRANGELLTLSARRLEPWLSRPHRKQAEIQAALTAERRAWNAYYDALDTLEAALARNDPAARQTARRFGALIETCRVTG